MATAAEISEYDTEELERQLGETRLLLMGALLLADAAETAARTGQAVRPADATR